MAGASSVRLVRCPKCHNLLPERPEVSVYKCGSCGAVLQAKKKGPTTVREGHGIATASETEMETSETEYNRREERSFRGKNVNLINRFSSRAEEKPVMLDVNGNGRDYNRGARHCQRQADKVIGFADKYRKPLKHRIDDGDRNVNTSINFFKGKSIEESSPSMKNSIESLKLRASLDGWGVEKDVSEGGYRNHNGVAGHGNFSACGNPDDEGPSSIKNFEGLFRPNRAQKPEEDQAELLWKLDELKYKISAICDPANKVKDGVPIDAKSGPSDAYGGPVTHNDLAKHFGQGDPHYFNSGKGRSRSVNIHDIDMHSIYFSRHALNGITGHEDLYRLHMFDTFPNHLLHQYPKQSVYDYLSKRHIDINRDHRSSHPHNTMYHQPGCSCSLCYNLNWQAPPQIPLVDLGHRRMHETPINSNLRHHASHFMMGTQNYSPQAPHPLFHSHDQLQHTGRPSGIDSDIDGLHRMRPRKEAVASMSRQLCFPLLGGAPFMTCCSCFELLKLPHRFKAKEKRRKKLRCGACSAVNHLEVKDNKLIIVLPTEDIHLTGDADNGLNEVLREGLLNSFACADTNDKNNFATDYNFHSMSVKENVALVEQKSSDSNKRQGGTTSCSISYEKGESCSISYETQEILDSIIVPGDTSSKLTAEDDDFSTNRFSHFAEHVNNSSPKHALSSIGDVNLSKRTNEENHIFNECKSGLKFVESVSPVTESVSFSDDLNTNLSQESTAASLEKDQSRINKGNQSFLKGLIKKRFRDFSWANPNIKTEKVNVWINGQPIPDIVVKKAEILAGPIQPGDYWYDFRSGFWGVMGQPCLGIIPSFIKEFQYPMPKNCANGNTSVFVNGRELHQQDLDVLAKRGLPVTRDKFYNIGITGRVLDEHSGEEIAKLGKLAPTVVKLKRGFGMRVPKAPV